MNLKPLPPTAADLECGSAVVHVHTGVIGWVIWAEADAVLVEISFGTGRLQWDVAHWPYVDVVVPGSHSDPSRVTTAPEPRPAATREVHTPAAPATSEHAGAAGPTDRPLPSAPDAGLRLGSGRSTGGQS